MTIEVIPGDVAWRNLHSNPRGKWPSREKPERLYPVATPAVNPKFRISPSDGIFCIGSCFAREIEQALKRLDFDVLSIIRNLPQSERRSGADAGMFNKYTVAAILNELRWALDPDLAYSHEQVLVENEAGLFEDYQLSGSNYADTLQDASAFRDGFNRAFAGIRDADVIAITLGLSEAWLDRDTGLYLNMAPSRKLVKKYPGRFEVCVFDYEETLSMLEEIHVLLQRHLKPSHRILITVSPVPLLATFREADVIVANAYSKAVLRTAVEKFQRNKSNVSYFPSYEFVVSSNPLAVWDDKDYRHVDRFFVEHIMSSVLSAYCDDSEMWTEMAALAKAGSLYRGRFYREAQSVLEPVVADAATVQNPKILLRWGMINKQLGNIDCARKAFTAYLQRCPEDERAITALKSLR